MRTDTKKFKQEVAELEKLSIDSYLQLEYDEFMHNHKVSRLINNNNQIKYGDYPDGLARLYGALNSQKGDFLILDAKPGYEFIGESSPEHTGGGAHGSMHKNDSLTPIIVTGTNKSMDNLRIVDLKKWILDLLK